MDENERKYDGPDDFYAADNGNDGDGTDRFYVRGSDSCGPAGPVDLMKTMMSGEDMEMFQNYMDLFDQELSSPGTSAMKGDSSHEWNNESYSE